MDEAGTHDNKPADSAAEPAQSAEATVIEGELLDVAEPSAPVIPPVRPVDYDEAGVPTFDYVRDRVEGRYATSTGSVELAGESPEAATLDEQLAERNRAGQERLEQIRRSMQ